MVDASDDVVNTGPVSGVKVPGPSVTVAVPTFVIVIVLVGGSVR